MTKVASQSAALLKFRNRYDAESQVCRAIAALGQLAGVDVDQGDGPADLDAELIQAAYQSNFDDPHFLGGPCCFNYVETAADITALAEKARVVSFGFSDYIRKRGSAEDFQRAEVHKALVDAAFAWLKITNRSP